MKPLELTVYRHTPNIDEDRNIIGDLFIGDKYFCRTLEDEIRPDGVKVKHETAIPAGRYKVNVTYSTRFKRQMPILLYVPMFEGIRIHGGNTSKNTSGCILVAYNTDFTKIWGTAENELTRILSKAEDEGKQIFINIKNTFLSYDRDLKKETI